jgi:hypothetical protein
VDGEVWVGPVVSSIAQEQLFSLLYRLCGHYLYFVLADSEFAVGGAMVKGVIKVGREAGGFTREGVKRVDGDAGVWVSERIGGVVGVGEEVSTGDLGATMV